MYICVFFPLSFFFEEAKMEYITESLKISAQGVPKTKLK